MPETATATAQDTTKAEPEVKPDPKATDTTAKPVVTPDPKVTPDVKPKETPAAAAELKKEDLTLPKDSPLDAKTVDEVLALAKAKKWDKETAQGVLDRESKSVLSYVEAQKSSIKELQSTWTQTAKNDKEIGGEKHAENVELAKRVIKRYATEDFQKILEGEGQFGNHPELVRVFVRIGKAMSEDQLFLTPKGSATKKDAADALYGDSSQEKK